MCSIGEDDFGDEGGVHAMVPSVTEAVGPSISDGIPCSKCKNPEAIYKLPFREAECKECFLLYARHKFRAALGSSKILPKNANVVLLFDGSPQSLVLLDMLHHAQQQNAFKRLHCNAVVLYIDDYQLMHETAKSIDDNHLFLMDLENILCKYSCFRSFVLPLVHKDKAEKFIIPLDTVTEDYFTQELELEKHAFVQSIKSIKSLTSRQDFVKHHRSKLIAVATKHFKCNFAFMSDISTDLASDLLSAVALGRGGSAALDVALVDDRLGDGVLLCRPIKDLSVIEIELYIKAQDLQVIPFKHYGDDGGSSASLQNLTQSFILNLQQNFSSTVSTVFRTGSKIATNQDLSSRLMDLKVNDACYEESSNPLYCSFCNSLLDYRDSTTLLAIEFSRVVSESGSTLDTRSGLNEQAEENLKGSNETQHLGKLCHGCRNICCDSTSEELLL